jgi:hypothetical protein
MRRCAALLIMLVGISTVLSCAASPDENEMTTIRAPDPEAFRTLVSPFLERRCGTLDCHGRVERPMRIYGLYGLRLWDDAGIPPIDAGPCQDLDAGMAPTPAQVPTTCAERAENYRFVVGLEPEQMSRVVARIAEPETLLLIQKPLGYEPGDGKGGVRHKGGPQIAPGKTQLGYRCIRSWLRGQTDADECRKAANVYSTH